MDGNTKQRYISTSIWSDDWFDTLSGKEKLIYIHLLTNENTNIAGIYKITVKRIKDDTGASREEVLAALDRFAASGKAFFVNDYIIIPKWPKHQKLDKRDKLKTAVKAILKSLPQDIKDFVMKPGNYCFDTSFLECVPDISYPENGQNDDNLSPKDGETSMGYPENGQNNDKNPSDSRLLILDSISKDIEIKNLENPVDPQSLSTASAVAHETADSSPLEVSADSGGALTGENKIAPMETGLVKGRSRSPPRKSRKLELNPDQLALFHAAKACFESSERAKALMYQDEDSTAREMKNLKTLVIRCVNIAPGFSVDFLRNVLEHFKVMCNGKHKGKMVFTPRSLVTPWIWEIVVESLPEAESPELRTLIRGLFK